MEYFIGQTPLSNTWNDIRQNNTPVSFTMNGTTYYTNQGLPYNNTRSLDNLNYDFDANVAPYYNLEDFNVNYIRQQTGFKILKVPALICECKVGSGNNTKYCRKG